jgi:hypothetical protein
MMILFRSVKWLKLPIFFMEGIRSISLKFVYTEITSQADIAGLFIMSSLSKVYSTFCFLRPWVALFGLKRLPLAVADPKAYKYRSFTMQSDTSSLSSLREGRFAH